MKRAIGLVLAILLSVSMLVRPAHASVNDFVVTNFEADYYLNKSDPQGHMDITEAIVVDFHDYNHGILRAIPSSYHSHPLHLKIQSVSSPTGTPSQYTTYKSNGNTVIKIGDPARTVTGQQSYVIKYSVDNVITYFNDHDELFWDINGDQWGQPFTQVTARFHISNDLQSKLNGFADCLTGTFGSQEKNCDVPAPNGNVDYLKFTASNLSPYETLSTVTGFKKGTFTPYSWRDTVAEHRGSIVISAVSLGAAVLVFRRWLRWGKDPKGSGIIVPEYGPPKGINLIDAGILQDYRLDNKDVTAVLIDLAIRGYIMITEEDKKTLFLKTGTSTSLTLKKIDDSLSEDELALMTALFKDLEPGSIVELGKYVSGMQGVISSIGKKSLKKLEAAGYFDKSPDRPGAWLFIWTMLLCIGLITAGFWSANYLGGIVSIACLLIIIVLAALMPRRTQMGVMYNEQLAGLKLYLNTAEADRIKMLQSPNAKYAANAKEPKRTVQLFEKLLPYAIIFGVEKEWAGQFANIYKQPPNWYNGNWTTFNTVMLASHISSATSSFNASFSPPSSSGSSGFSGGGAGGGGGGGGGGGW